MPIATTTGFAEVNGGKLYYEMAGEGETVVFSHAAFIDSGMWDAQFEEFAKEFRVIRYDMRGYGRSDDATGPVSRRDDLRAVVTSLGVTRAMFIGCSMGAEAVLDLSLEHPELVAKQILITGLPSGFSFEGYEEPRYVQEMIAAMQAGDYEKASDYQIRIWVDGPHREPGDVDPEIRRRASVMNLNPTRRGTFFIADNEPPNPLDPPAYGRLDQVKCPTFVMTGALDEGVVVESAKVMAEQIPAARLLIIENAAHVPSMERPETFNPAALEFLRNG